MKLFQYKCRKDFGVEHIFFLLRGKKFSLLQFSVSCDDYPSFPYIQVSSGNNGLLDILCYVYRFSFNVELIGRNWEHYLDKVVEIEWNENE
jgi:hypothetical protein